MVVSRGGVEEGRVLFDEAAVWIRTSLTKEDELLVNGIPTPARDLAAAWRGSAEVRSPRARGSPGRAYILPVIRWRRR